MPPPPIEPSGYLPRLPADTDRGRAMVFWTHTVKDRARGWLSRDLHLGFRELLLQVAVREQLLCPVHPLMPDHLHLIWIGVHASSDLRRASAFLRRRLEPMLGSCRFQQQPYDHVFRERERMQGAFMAICHDITENPVRAGLVRAAPAWPYTGCSVPGLPDLHPAHLGFRERFWRIHAPAVECGGLFRMER